jgi:hypothetical protein
MPVPSLRLSLSSDSDATVPPCDRTATTPSTRPSAARILVLNFLAISSHPSPLLCRRPSILNPSRLGVWLVQHGGVVSHGRLAGGAGRSQQLQERGTQEARHRASPREAREADHERSRCHFEALCAVSREEGRGRRTARPSFGLRDLTLTSVSQAFRRP